MIVIGNIFSQAYGRYCFECRLNQNVNQCMYELLKREVVDGLPYLLNISGMRNSEVTFQPGVSFYSCNKSPTKMACSSESDSSPLSKQWHGHCCEN